MKRRPFGNHEAAGPAEHVVIGVHPIAAWLERAPSRIKCLNFDGLGARRFGAIFETATRFQVPVAERSRDDLTLIAGTPDHQGLVAVCTPYPYATLDSVVDEAPSLVVVADHIQDPHNLGAVIRSAEAAGVGAVILPQDRAAPVTPAVEVAAAGATAFVRVARVVNLVRAVDKLKEHGYWAAGLVAHDGADLFNFDVPNKLVLVVGGETGLGSLILRQCDHLVTIPIVGRSESLNASVAAAVALFEVRRRWRKP